MKHEVCGFEHLHLHTDFSLLDGFGKVEEYAARAPEINQQFLCVTDHGMLGAVPRQIKSCEENGIMPIFGCELYVNPLQPEAKDLSELHVVTSEFSPEEKEKLRKSYHLLAIAYNDVGYSNLVNLCSWAWLNGYYYRPRVNHEMLLKHKEGLIFTSCCISSEIGQAFLKEGEESAFDMVEKYMAMFGDNFYLELMMLDFDKQKPYDKFIIKAHDKYGIPIELTQDCHYCYKEDSHYQRLMLMIQGNKTVDDVRKAEEQGTMGEMFELQDKNLWMRSEDELNEKWESDYSDVIDYDLFKQAKRTTVDVCNKAKGVELDRSIKLPKIPDANEKLMEAIIGGFGSRNLPKTNKYLSRIKEEYELICKKEFSSYFLIQKMMTDEARRICPELLGWGDGSEAVGAGRGSAVGSLICYCLYITDVDPVHHDLLFSRFMSEARGGKSMKLRFSKAG